MVIRAAICDDEPSFLDLLYEHISAEFKRQDADIRIDRFTSGYDLLNKQAAEAFDVVFLDIDMPEISGFEVAEKIDNSEQTLIVFVSTHDDLVYSSLKFQPFRFIRKAHLEDEIGETVKSTNEKLLKRKVDQRIKFRTKENEVYIFVNDIKYIEIYRHRLRVILNDGEPFECYGSLSEFENRLLSNEFIRTYKSYLVNFKYIYSIGKTQVTLDNGTEIPLSRYKANEVKEKFKEYLRGKL